MIRRLWKGEVRLVITYWVYFALVFLIYSIIIKSLTGSFMDLGATVPGRILLYALIFFPLIYSPFIFVAVWRSANRYTKGKGWPYLAKVVIVINAIILAVSIPTTIKNLFFHNPSIDAIAQATVVYVNKHSPKMLDNETELLGANYNNHVLSYEYKLINKTPSSFDASAFTMRMQKKLSQLACSGKNLKPFLDKGVSVSFNYADLHGKPISNILVSPSDCKNLG